MPGTVFGQDLSDANLFRRVRRGDTRSFGVLVHRHDPSLRKLVSRLLADTDQVDAVLHKAYSKTWRTAAMARIGSGRSAVGNWFYRVVYNTCVDELRRQASHPGPEPLTGPRVRLPNTSVERRLSALRALNPRERIPLVLVDSEGFDVAAAARVLQRKPAEVAADLAAARRRWRDLVIGPPEPVDPAVATTGEDADRAEDAEQAQDLQDAQQEGPAGGPEAAPQERAGESGTGESGTGESEPQEESSPVPEVSGNGSKPVEATGLPEAETGVEAPERGGPEVVTPKTATTPKVASSGAGVPDGASDLVHAAEDAFDSERFTRLKRWFKSKGGEDVEDPAMAEPLEPLEEQAASADKGATR